MSLARSLRFGPFPWFVEMGEWEEKEVEEGGGALSGERFWAGAGERGPAGERKAG
jgi:hypothetical protein